MMPKFFLDLTFDEQSSLFKNDPDTFERLARDALNDFTRALPHDKQEEARAIQIELDLYLKGYEGDERFNMFLLKFGETFQKFQRVMNGDYSDDLEVEIDFISDE